MKLTAKVIQDLQTSFSQMFRGAYRDTPTFWQHLAMRVPSSTATNTYGWMQRLLQMRKWVGPRLVQNLKTHSYVLENEPFEATVGVLRDDIADDQLGIYGPLMQELGRVAKYLPDQLVLQALLAGSASTSLGFDKQPFFSGTHDLDPAGLQANQGAEVLSQDGWSTVRAKMRSYTGEDGRPLAVLPKLVVAPPEAEQALKIIFNAERVDTGSSGGNSNMTKNEASYVIIPELAGTTDWYVFDNSSAMRALIWQEREAVKLVSRTQPTDDNNFWQKELIWGVDGRGVVGYGPWWLAHKSTGGFG